MSELRYSLHDIGQAIEILEAYRQKRKALDPRGPVCIALFGDLGAGKTTLVRAWCEYLEVDPDTISSPTYAYVNEYEAPNLRIFHFDVYRLSEASEFLDLGFEEYLTDMSDTPTLVIIEWPERIADLLRTIPHMEVHLSYVDAYQRCIESTVRP